MLTEGEGRERLDKPGPEVIIFISCSTQLSMEFILLINIIYGHFNIYEQEKILFMGILTFMSRKKHSRLI